MELNARLITSGQVAAAFNYELEDSMVMIHDGLKLWRDNKSNAFASASILFCTGIEKFMKLILILDCLDSKEAVSKRTLQGWGHDLEVLFQEITRRGLWVNAAVLVPFGGTLEVVQSDEDLRRLREILRFCSGWYRYANLNAIVKPSVDGTLDTPMRDFNRLHCDWAFEADPEWEDGEHASAIAWARIFTSLQRWVRALCRILALGKVKDEGRTWLGLLKHFNSLRDEELSLVKG